LGLIREKFALTQGSAIAMERLVVNLKKLLGLLFILFTGWLYLLWARVVTNDAHSQPISEPVLLPRWRRIFSGLLDRVCKPLRRYI
jgi:hypothetical protein